MSSLAAKWCCHAGAARDPLEGGAREAELVDAGHRRREDPRAGLGAAVGLAAPRSLSRRNDRFRHGASDPLRTLGENQ
jgi:hypothetical protein